MVLGNFPLGKKKNYLHVGQVFVFKYVGFIFSSEAPFVRFCFFVGVFLCVCVFIFIFCFEHLIPS